jgi:hypothetical protein
LTGWIWKTFSAHVACSMKKGNLPKCPHVALQL